MAAPQEGPSGNIHRNTPANFLAVLRRFDAVFLDPCSNATSTVGAVMEWRGGRRGLDGLARPWGRNGLVYVNPPYGKAIRAWIDKMRAEAEAGAEIIALVPSRTDAAWWQNHGATAVCQWAGRMTFPPLTTPAMFPSAVLYYGKRPRHFATVFSPHGAVMTFGAIPRDARAIQLSGELRAGIYHRASTRDQDPELALEELRAAARARRASIVLERLETGSGANNDRPGLQDILEAGRRRKLDVVLVWKLDRFGRSCLDLLTNIRALNDAGVKFVATTQGIDVGGTGGGDAASRLTLQVLAGVAEFERELLIDRTHRGLQTARERGKRLGRPPAMLPELADVLELQAADLSLREIAANLHTPVWRVRQALAKKGG